MIKVLLYIGLTFAFLGFEMMFLDMLIPVFTSTSASWTTRGMGFFLCLAFMTIIGVGYVNLLDTIKKSKV
jgi:hypothetical protein